MNELGWKMRVYSALEPGNAIGNLKLKELFEGYPFVHLCNVTRILELRNISRPLFQMTWRFLPLLDPLVDRMLCRDLDSLVTAREVAAVNQWLDSKSTFHWMHDHPLHCASAFLGGNFINFGTIVIKLKKRSTFSLNVGVWGAKIDQNRRAISNAAIKMLYETQHEMNHGFDQWLLNRYLYELAENDVVSLNSKINKLYPLLKKNINLNRRCITIVTAAAGILTIQYPSLHVG